MKKVYNIYTKDGKVVRDAIPVPKEFRDGLEFFSSGGIVRFSTGFIQKITRQDESTVKDYNKEFDNQ